VIFPDRFELTRSASVKIDGLAMSVLLPLYLRKPTSIVRGHVTDVPKAPFGSCSTTSGLPL
jgi:hypothetical protein